MVVLTHSTCFHFHFSSPSIARVFSCIVLASFCCVLSSLGSPFSSISTLVLHLSWELHLNSGIFVSSSVQGTLLLKLLVLPFSFIFVCFHWLCTILNFFLHFVVLVVFIWPHLCSLVFSVFGVTTALQQVCFYHLWNGRTIWFEWLFVWFECLFGFECFLCMFDIYIARMVRSPGMFDLGKFCILFEHCCMIGMLVKLECLNGLCV